MVILRSALSLDIPIFYRANYVAFIECPKHNGRFNYKTGKGLGAPIITDLRTYSARVDGDDVFIEIG